MKTRTASGDTYPFRAAVGDAGGVLVEEVRLAGVVHHRDLARRRLSEPIVSACA